MAMSGPTELVRQSKNGTLMKKKPMERQAKGTTKNLITNL
jgi:hypothetical protein